MQEAVEYDDNNIDMIAYISYHADCICRLTELYTQKGENKTMSQLDMWFGHNLGDAKREEIYNMLREDYDIDAREK